MKGKTDQADSGDCDVLLTHEDGISHLRLVREVKASLEDSGFLIEKGNLGMERVGAWNNETVTTRTASRKYTGANDRRL
jgi:hypothetical protein